MAVTNRALDYCGFAVRFIGVGYLVLWPLARPDPFGLARLCRPDALPWKWLCHWPQLVHLTPGLHLLGTACAGVLAIELALRLGARVRRAHAARTDAALVAAAAVPAALAGVPPRSACEPPLPKVEPRSEFGLRGRPHARSESGVVSPASAPRAPAEPNESQ